MIKTKWLYLACGIAGVISVTFLGVAGISSALFREENSIESEAPLTVKEIAEVAEKVTEEVPVAEPTPVAETPVPTPAPTATSIPVQNDPLQPTDRPVVHAPGTVTTPENENRIVTALEYIYTYNGVCPSAQPDNVFKEHQGVMAALGLVASYPSLEWAVESVWQGYMTHHPNVHGYMASLWQLQMEEDADDHNIAFYMDWENELVYWDDVWQENRPYDPARPHKDSWDAKASYMTTYLRSLNSRYKSLCPNG